MRPTLEYASSVWSPMASPTSINKLQVMQNAALRACTGCTHDTNIQHLYGETNILPIQKHLQLHASQVRQKAQYPSHPLYLLLVVRPSVYSAWSAIAALHFLFIAFSLDLEVRLLHSFGTIGESSICL